MYRQGDVVIVRVDEIPEAARPLDREGGRVVLAHGEATGHAHAIAERHVALLSETGGRDVCFLSIEGAEAWLRHEEHAPICLPMGKYRVIRQREYTPEAIRNVRD